LYISTSLLSDSNVFGIPSSISLHYTNRQSFLQKGQVFQKTLWFHIKGREDQPRTGTRKKPEAERQNDTLTGQT
jgi:hypothetical protein